MEIFGFQLNPGTFVAGIFIGWACYELHKEIKLRFKYLFKEQVKCDRCDSQMVKIDSVYHHVQYRWNCKVCGYDIWKVDKDLLKKRRQEVGAR